MGQSVHSLVDETVLYKFKIFRHKATPGANADSINRVIARIFNSFEKNRIQAKLFLGIQKELTMIKYASSWNGFIKFLLRLLTDTQICPILSIRYLDSLSDLGDLVRAVNISAEALHATNSEQLSFEKCLKILDLSPDSESENQNSEPAKPLQMLAVEFVKLIDDLCFVVIRFHWEQSFFFSPVIGFVVLHVFNEEGVWITAKDLTFRLYGWIHCMQLWFLIYCLRK